MEFYKSRIIQGEFNRICEKINIELFNSGFRFLIENNLKNQIKLELGVSTNKWKILGAANFPIDLIELNPYDGPTNIIYFKLMLYEINNKLLKISAMEPILNEKYLLDSKFRSIFSDSKQRIIRIIENLHNQHFTVINNEDGRIFYPNRLLQLIIQSSGN